VSGGQHVDIDVNVNLNAHDDIDVDLRERQTITEHCREDRISRSERET
jgi:hypothetical protein